MTEPPVLAPMQRRRSSTDESFANAEWTNSESSRSKLAIVGLNYIDDPFIGSLCPHSPLKRTPEINRGYYGRCQAVGHAIRKFIGQEGGAAQVVNIGCGSDSLYFRLKADPTIGRFARVVDVDTSHVIANKVKAVNKCEELLRHLDGIRADTHEDSFHSERYHMVSADASKGRQLTRVLMDQCDVNPSDPVLFVFECVLLYWTGEQTSTLLYSLCHTFKKSSFLVFDVVNTSDTFSHVMQDSLSQRDTPLLGVASSATLDDWRQKFENNGCKYVKAWDMNTVYETLLSRTDRQRIERIEFLDEVELLAQLLSHYCLVLASNYSPVDW